jgi:hypothetical protein
MKINSYLSLLCILVSLQAFAEKKEHHAGMSAHEHGTLTLEVAVEGKKIDIEIEAPAENFLGFEYAPKTEKDKKIFSSAETLWNKDLITKLFDLDKYLGCKLISSSFNQVMDGSHSEIQAKAEILCNVELKGKSAIINFKKYFSHIKNLSVALVSSETKTIKITKSSEVIKL